MLPAPECPSRRFLRGHADRHVPASCRDIPPRPVEIRPTHDEKARPRRPAKDRRSGEESAGCRQESVVCTHGRPAIGFATRPPPSPVSASATYVQAACRALASDEWFSISDHAPIVAELDLR